MGQEEVPGETAVKCNFTSSSLTDNDDGPFWPGCARWVFSHRAGGKASWNRPPNLPVPLGKVVAPLHDSVCRPLDWWTLREKHLLTWYNSLDEHQGPGDSSMSISSQMTREVVAPTVQMSEPQLSPATWLTTERDR